MSLLPNHLSCVFPIDDANQIGAARRGVGALAKDAGLSEEGAARPGLVATELATNLLLHARAGQLLVCLLPGTPAKEVEVLAVDSGPGMADVDRCMREGFSTASTAGQGLGAVRRLANLNPRIHELMQKNRICGAITFFHKNGP